MISKLFSRLRLAVGSTTSAEGRQRGAIALITALAFLAIALPLITGALGLSRTLGVDSSVKTDVLKRHYSASAGLDYGTYLLNYLLGFADSLQVGVPYVFTFTLNGKAITVTITLTDPGSVQTTEKWADIVMALDNSGSIDTLELLDLKNASNTIVDHFDLGTSEGRMRIGISRFRGTSASVVSMTDIDDHISDPQVIPLHIGINNLVQGGPGLGSGTNIVAGLQGGGAQFATGLGDRDGVPNLLIFITDGNDTEGNSLAQIAAASQNTGAEVFAVGVGDLTIATLDAIATDDDPADPDYNPADPNAGHRFYASDFSGLLAIIDSIVETVTQAAQNRVFVIRSQVTGQAPSEMVVVLPP